MYNYEDKPAWGFAAFGIIGGIILSTADWLLGTVGGNAAAQNMFFNENCVNIPLGRLSISMILALFGTIFFLWGLFLQKSLYKSECQISKNIYAFLCIAGGATWLFIHFLYAVYRACLIILSEKGFAIQEAMSLTEQLSAVFIPASIIASVLMILPHLFFMICLIAKKTVLPRWFCLFYMIVFSVIFGIIGSITKGSAFANGLSMAGSNMALTLWFVFIMIFGRKNAD